ncbi:Peptidyl-prolyl cis-trans isomerase cyp6 [Orbilia oligospora]|uniref:Peptidyl-prolyl cis-trans isomerase n=1 Tax=Orbilia oligospora TaxID=2813651 RepID=A0A6G1M2C5_ORBOL|nr:Peptidyl-prolyl cis-trans isomerase cyp6 [Orbilia oligospora]KAF3201519.1 Peptidyl-prolyl cis-trans isomerase cyp6 [Orbilia oligospora]KAF3213845.1 Peptidyl-prolyl cis-trans isomerase cyp6 [Orbilia oligospora]KAF3241207.1 Peptidyl-prolyl cis-trans isomerase cyp6 [Orbilia oligospora]
MSVLLETSAGDLVIDLLVDDAPQTCLNFLKLCKVKYYNFSPVYNVQKDFSFQTGDPIGPGQSGSDGGSSIWGKLQGASKKYFESEFPPKLKHSERGTVSMATAPAGGDDNTKRISGSQFLITLGDSLDYLDGKGSIFGRVVEGFDTLEAINSAFCDDQGWPLKDIRIRHTIILDDPFDDPPGLVEPPESPIPTKEQLATVRIGEDEDLNEEADEETAEMQRREREARAQALTLEMVGDLPFADVKPPENVLFVCKLNPVTQDEDLELIFSRFGKILSCEVIRDQRTGDSLQYAFIEFETQQDCEQAYFKMDGVLIDDHRIHVDFSQSVSKLSDSWRMDTNAKRRAYADSKGYGGSSQLQKKQQYKSGDVRKTGALREGREEIGGATEAEIQMDIVIGIKTGVEINMQMAEVINIGDQDPVALAQGDEITIDGKGATTETKIGTQGEIAGTGTKDDSSKERSFVFTGLDEAPHLLVFTPQHE